MRPGFTRIFAAGLFSISMSSLAPAADLGLLRSSSGPLGSCSEIVLTCENGKNYPLCPIAVSIAGEIVTASLYTSPRGATKVRMIPMGVGYRYAGVGVWFDGLRDEALLNFGKRRAVACEVNRS